MNISADDESTKLLFKRKIILYINNNNYIVTNKRD